MNSDGPDVVGARRQAPADMGIVVLLVALCLGAFVWDAVLARVMTSEPMNDFGKFYYSARAFLDGRDMYAPSPATDMRFEKGIALQLLNMNPPHFHLAVLPLALLAPAQAVTLWMVASILALILSVLLVSHELRFNWSLTRFLLVVLGALVFAGTQAFFATGQLSLFLLLAMTICWLHARGGRWPRAAIWLGACLSVKPFLLIFIPYLVGTRRFRALGIALATAAGCFAIGLLVFGAHAHAEWFGAMRQSGDWAWTAMNASTFGVFRRAFDSTPSYTPAALSPQIVNLWIVPAAVIGLLTLAIASADTALASTDRAFALLLVAAQLVSPLGWVYYLWLPAGPVAALMRRPQTGGSVLRRAKAGLAVAAGVGAAWPLVGVYLLQPHSWATLTIGSVYFWAAVAAWAWLVVDYASTRMSMIPPT